MKKCTIETTDLRTLLDSLTNGEHVKATWKRGEVEVTAEGPVHVDGPQHRSCHRVIRSGMLAQGPEVKAFEEEFSEHFGLGRAWYVPASGVGDAVLEIQSAIHPCALPWQRPSHSGRDRWPGRHDV